MGFISMLLDERDPVAHRRGYVSLCSKGIDIRRESLSFLCALIDRDMHENLSAHAFRRRESIRCKASPRLPVSISDFRRQSVDFWPEHHTRMHGAVSTQYRAIQTRWALEPPNRAACAIGDIGNDDPRYLCATVTADEGGPAIGRAAVWLVDVSVAKWNSHRLRCEREPAERQS